MAGGVAGFHQNLQFNAIGIARVSQHLFGSLRVIAMAEVLVEHVLVIAQNAGGHHAAGRGAQVAIGQFDGLGDVDGVGNRLTHRRIVQRGNLGVHHQVDGVCGRGFDNLHALHSCDGFLLTGVHIDDDIRALGLGLGGTAGHIAHEAEPQIGGRGLAFTPVVLVGDHVQTVTRYILFHRIGAGADGSAVHPVAAGGVIGRLAGDAQAGIGQALDQGARRTDSGQNQGVVVHHFAVGDVQIHDLGDGRQAVFYNALEAPKHVVRGEGSTIAELHALTQVDHQVGIVLIFIALTQPVLQLAIGVQDEQGLIDVMDHIIERLLVNTRGLQRAGVHGDYYRQSVAARCGGLTLRAAGSGSSGGSALASAAAGGQAQHHCPAKQHCQ